MTIDGLLTFLGLLAAVFAVISRAQRLNLWLKVRPVHILVVCVSFIAIIALEFYDSLVSLSWVPPSVGWLLKPNEIAFLIALASVPLVAPWVHFGSLPKRRVHMFRDLIEELVKTEQYIEAIRLMDAHLDRLARIHRQDFLFARIRKWLESFHPLCHASIESVLRRLNLSDAGASNDSPPPSHVVVEARAAMSNLFRKLVAGLGRLLPSGEGTQRCAAEIFRLALLHPEYIRAVVRIRPYSGLRVLSLDIPERYDFSDEYFRQLLANRTSILYWEIKNNRLFRHIFHDAHVAEALGVWQPIGEQMIAELDRLHRNADDDHYNGPLEDYRERGQWKCPLFVGIRFFDIMVSEAIDQNIQWHMWLYYFTYVTDRICRNYQPDPEKIDLDVEFPTPYSSLLYEIVSTLRNWIRKVEDLPPEQDNSVLESTTLVHENGNPIKSSILALGECLRAILIAQNVTPQLKHYLASIVFNLYFQFVRQESLVRYAEVLRNVLLAGGLFERQEDGPEYLGGTIQGLVRNDNVPHRQEDVLQLMRVLVLRFIGKFGQARLTDYVSLETLAADSIRVSSNRHAYTIDLSGSE
jgi:hypothetical protein